MMDLCSIFSCFKSYLFGIQVCWMNESPFVGLHEVKPWTWVSQLFPADVSLWGGQAPLLWWATMTFIQISTSVFLFSLFGAQIFPGQNPYTSHFGSERGKAIYIIGKFPCMEKTLPNFCDCRPGSGMGRVVLVGWGCPISPCIEAVPDGKPHVRIAAPAAWAHRLVPPQAQSSRRAWPHVLAVSAVSCGISASYTCSFILLLEKSGQYYLTPGEGRGKRLARSRCLVN